MNEELKKRLVKIAEDNELKGEEVLQLFEVMRLKVKEIDPHLGDAKLDKRTYNGILNYFSNKKFAKGKEFLFIPFGVQSEARDQNKGLRDEILKDFADPEKRKDVIKQGKVMCMKISDQEIDNKEVFYNDVYKPVRKITKFTMVNDVYVVTEGELWEPGDTPIARDYRQNLSFGKGENEKEYENFRYSYPLDPRWKLVIFGLGYFPGFREMITDTGIQKVQKTMKSDGVLCKVAFWGDYADPNSAKFVLKKPIWFIPCKVKATENQSISSALNLNVTSKTEIEMSDVKPKIEKLAKQINVRIDKEAKQAYGRAKQAKETEDIPKEQKAKIMAMWKLYKKFAGKDYIPFIDLAQIDSWHKERRAVRDEDGNILKDGVWDKIDFDAFALSECTLNGIYEKEGKTPKIILSDISLPQDQSSIFCGFAKGIDTKLPNSSVIISLTTSRGNKVYDPDTRTYIEDEEGATAFAKVKGVRVLVDFTKIDVDKLFGDI
jgi:hypothetical protein